MNFVVPLMVEITKIPLREPLHVTEGVFSQISERANITVPGVACHRIPDISILDQKRGLLDHKVVKTHFLNEGRLTDPQVYKILTDADTILSKEPNLLKIDRKCYIFGDIHGQFYDLVPLIDLFNLEVDVLVFLGDYVDRGCFSVEVYLYLMLLKSRYPDNIFLLRGNHESERMTRYFTFKAECLHKYGLEIYERFVESFKTLPIAAVIQGMAFCSHGGISPCIKKVEDLNLINRFKEIEYTGVFCDIFWSDPHIHYDTKTDTTWDFNARRRCSVQYSYQNVIQFLEQNSLSMIIRGHEVQEQGFQLFKEYKEYPSVITLFSAPKYCDAYQNVGAFIEFNNGVVDIKQFDAIQHPFVINGFIDGVNWSLPFIGEKAIEFALSLFDELDNIEILNEPEVLATKMAVMRAEREAIDEFEEEDSTFVDCCTLQSRENDELTFEAAKDMDAKNEKKKDKFPESNISIELSPSLQNETIREISNLKLDPAIKSNKIVVDSQNNNVETVSVRGNTKKKYGLGFLCGIFRE